MEDEGVVSMAVAAAAVRYDDITSNDDNKINDDDEKIDNKASIDKDRDRPTVNRPRRKVCFGSRYGNIGTYYWTDPKPVGGNHPRTAFVVFAGSVSIG